MRRRVLLIGVSTRAMAESAARAGFAVISVDAFADRDQHADVRALRLPGNFSVRSIERAARAIEADAVAYTSPIENHPAVVQALAAERMLWGNGPGVLRRVRDPERLADALRQRGLRGPVTRGRASAAHVFHLSESPMPGGHDWLMKPVRSGGGHRVRPWRPGAHIPRGSYVQRFVDGESWSAVFVASGRGAVTLGLSRQLIGDPAFGASGFRYCGSVIDLGTEALRERTAAVARAVSEEFGLIGVNGFDFIRQGDEPVVIEVNPRWSGSMELVERACGRLMFRLHAAACTTGELPPVLVSRAARVHGKAIVFARQTVTVGDTTAWLDAAGIRDVPHSGERIAAGRPVCTVIASAADADGCYAELVARARTVYEQLAGWRRRVA